MAVMETIHAPPFLFLVDCRLFQLNVGKKQLLNV